MMQLDEIPDEENRSKVYEYNLLMLSSPPYTFFLLNGDMEFYRDRHLFI